LSFCFSSSCVPPMLPVSLDCPFFFFHLVYPYVASFSMRGAQDEEKQNDNPEKLAT
jgi:hypothetical protein